MDLCPVRWLASQGSTEYVKNQQVLGREGWSREDAGSAKVVIQALHIDYEHLRVMIMNISKI